MRAYRENAAGEIEIFAHRWKTGLVLGGCALFALACVAILLADVGEVWARFGLAFFGGLSAVLLRRYARRGFLTGKPMVVVGPSAIRDRNSGVDLTWEQVERVEFWEQHTRGGTLRYVGLWARDPDVVLRQLRGFQRFMSRLGAGLRFGPAERVNIPLSMLGTTPEEMAGILRRFWNGPIDGYDGELPDRDEPIRRPSRSKRLRGWAIEWAIGIALAIPILALIIWLGG